MTAMERARVQETDRIVVNQATGCYQQLVTRQLAGEFRFFRPGFRVAWWYA